jgi:hypothetical protein
MKASEAISVCDPEFDSLFHQLVLTLDTCSKEHGDCGQCPLRADCVKTYDSVCDGVTHYKIKEQLMHEFLAKHKGLKKQLSYC